jgi:hypothetical protein
MSRKRWGLALALVVLGTAALALVTRALPALTARMFSDTRGAQWIWEPRSRTDQSPTAFYAVRDFELGTPPARARLLVTADEEYVLALNGKRIGAGSFGPGPRLDAYEVGPLLLPGGNRLLVELRSGRGTGGFLASLVDGNGEPIVRTDASWRIFRRHEPGLARGWLPAGGGEPALVWGYPPIGRWGWPKAGREKPLFPELTRRPAPGRAVPLPPTSEEIPGAALRNAGALFDFGGEVTGYLDVEWERASDPERRAALLFTGLDTPPDPLAGPPAEGIVVLPGKRRWLDARARRFRYALIVGKDRPDAVRVLPLDPAAAARAGLPEPAEKAEAGVFGVDPPPLRTPVEDEVWSELQRLPGVARREEL